MIFQSLLMTSVVLAGVSLTSASPIASGAAAKRTFSAPVSSIHSGSSIFVPPGVSWIGGLDRLQSSPLCDLQQVDFGSHFDNHGSYQQFFGGLDNFNSHSCFSNIVTAEQVTQVQCEPVFSEEVVFQWAFSMMEIVKKLLTEQVCHVEKRLILHRAITSHFVTFGHSLSHSIDVSPGYDHGLLSSLHGHSILKNDGSFDLHDLGFNLNDLNSKTFTSVSDDWSSSTQASLDQLSGLFSGALTPKGFVQPVGSI